MIENDQPFFSINSRVFDFLELSYQNGIKSTQQIQINNCLKKMPVQIIDIPEQIVREHDFCEQIERINQKAYLQVEYLKKLTEKSHEIYANSSQSILSLIDHFDKKIVNYEGSSQFFIRQFFSSFKQLYTNLNHQASKNIIYINSKKRDNIKSIKQAIERKIKEVSIRIDDLKEQVQSYNKIAQKYKKKVQYFSSLDKDPIKFYSIKKNQEKYKRINELEFVLEGNLDKIQKIKSDIKILFQQLALKVNYYFESIKTKVDQLKKTSLTLKNKQFPTLGTIDKIQEVSEKDQFSAGESAYQSPRNHKKEYKMHLSPEAEIKQAKRQAQFQFQNHSQAENLMIEFLKSFVKQVKNTEGQIKKIEEEKNFKCFKTNEIFQFFNNETICGVEKIFAESQNFFKTMDRIVIIISPEFFKQVLKYRTQIFKNYIEKTENLLGQKDRYQTPQLLQCYYSIERKYSQTNRESKYRFCEKIAELLEEFRKLFESQIKVQRRKKIDEQDILSKRYYEILKLPYFINSQISGFQKDKSLVWYEKVINSNRFLQAEFELQSQMHMDTGKKTVGKTSCCGLIKSKQQIVQHEKINSFSCTLKDGIILYQGKIQLFSQYLRFKSSFHPQNFFCSIDIYIPKWNIQQIAKGNQFASDIITVVTAHGNIELTSFFSDPYQLLIDLYCPKSHVYMMDSIIQESELQDLQNCFENSFLVEVQRQKILIKEKSMLRSDKNTLVARFRYCQLVKQTTIEIYFFQVTMKYFENAMEYMFLHSEGQKNREIKKKLQSIAQNIIHKDQKKMMKNQMKMKDYEEQVSISFDFNDVSQINQPSKAFNHQLTGDFMNLGQNSPRKHRQTPRQRKKNHSFISHQQQNRENTPSPKRTIQRSMTNSFSKKSASQSISRSAVTIKQGHLHRSMPNNPNSSKPNEQINNQIRTDGYKMITIFVGVAMLILVLVSKLI